MHTGLFVDPRFKIVHCLVAIETWIIEHVLLAGPFDHKRKAGSSGWGRSSSSRGGGRRRRWITFGHVERVPSQRSNQNKMICRFFEKQGHTTFCHLHTVFSWSLRRTNKKRSQQRRTVCVCVWRPTKEITAWWKEKTTISRDLKQITKTFSPFKHQMRPNKQIEKQLIAVSYILYIWYIVSVCICRQKHAHAHNRSN